MKFKKNYGNKVCIFFKDVDIEKVLVSNNISCGEKNYKYFIGYLYNDYKVNPLNMLPKRNSYVKRYDGQIKWIQYTSANSNTQGTNIFVRINECLN